MHYFGFVAFIIAWLAAIIGAHYYLYFAALRFFSMAELVPRHVLFVSILLLSVSFILASVAAHWWYAFFTRSLYFLTAVWLGTLVNLLIAALLTDLALWLSAFAGLNINAAIPATLSLALALIISLGGVWNAMHPRLKEISVHIPGLPDNWKNKKIVQISDVHLGLIYKAGFMRQIVEKINTVKPEMVVITGDLFDGMDGDLNNLAAPLDDINAAKGVFFITGNHETYLGVGKVFAALQKTKVRALRDEVADVDGLKLIGLDFPERFDHKDPVATLHSLEKYFLGTPNILLFHAPFRINEFKDSGVNLQLSGHTHKGQMFPFGYITRKVFKGYDYGLYKMGNYTLYTTNGSGTWGPPMRTDNIPEIVVITLN